MYLYHFNIQINCFFCLRSSSTDVTEGVSSLFDCELITLMETVPGQVSVSSSCVSFTAAKESVGGSSWDFKIALNQLRELHLRNFNHRRSALEFFLIDQTNYLINFTKEVCCFYALSILLYPPSSILELFLLFLCILTMKLITSSIFSE